MEDYIQLSLFTADADLRDQLMAMLVTIGYEGFDESDPQRLLAFVPAQRFEAGRVEAVCATLGVDYQLKKLAGQNWNASWESNFEPVVVDDFVFIKAPFHEARSGFDHTLHIMPKMSFGTGHHATTQLMMRAMRGLDLDGKTVLDFGTGTGVLAILAAKLGAQRVAALDNESWSVENTLENAEANGVEVEAFCSDGLADVQSSYDVVLANINLHVLQANATEFRRIGGKNAVYLFSGLLHTDEAVFAGLLRSSGLRKVAVEHLNGWIMVRAVQH